MERRGEARRRGMKRRGKLKSIHRKSGEEERREKKQEW